MSVKKDIKVSDINDIFVYEDGKNKVYCGPFSYTGYILSNKEAKAYNVYSTRYYLPLSFAILAFIVSSSILISIVCLVALFIIMEIMFRRNVLANCPTIDNFVKPKRNSIFDVMAKKFVVLDLIVPLILSILLSIAIPINAKYSNYQGIVLYGNYVISIFVFFLALFFLISIIKIRGKK